MIRAKRQGLGFVVGFIALFFASSAAAFSAGTAVSQKKRYDPIINVVGRKYSVPAELIHSIIKAESNYNGGAVSPKGAVGLMQLMPDTAKAYGVPDSFDPVENIEGGVKFLKDLISLYGGKTKMVLAAYNAGQEAVKKFNGIPPYPETRNYINRVMASYSQSHITVKTKIFKYYDSAGNLVLTNDPFFVRPNSKQ